MGKELNPPPTLVVRRVYSERQFGRLYEYLLPSSRHFDTVTARRAAALVRLSPLPGGSNSETKMQNITYEERAVAFIDVLYVVQSIIQLPISQGNNN